MLAAKVTKNQGLTQAKELARCIKGKIREFHNSSLNPLTLKFASLSIFFNTFGWSVFPR